MTECNVAFMFCTNPTLKMLDLPDLLTQSGFSSSPNGASENLASKEKESTVITKPTPFPS